MKMIDNSVNENRFIKYSKLGDIKGVKEMIYNGEVNINFTVIEKKSSEKKNALYYALINGHHELSDYLIRIGLEIQRLYSSTITKIAVNGYFKVLELIIEHKKDMDIHKVVSINLVGVDKLPELVKYSEYFDIDPIGKVANEWNKQLSNVTSLYRPMIVDKLDNIKKLRREYNIVKITQTS